MLKQSSKISRERSYFDPSTRAQKEGWSTVKIGDIARIDNGNAFKSSEYIESGARVIRITNVQKGMIVDDSPKYIDEERAAVEFQKYQLYDQDLLMSLTGNVGRVGIINNDLLPALLNQRVARITPDTSKIRAKYLFYLLNSNNFEQAAIASASGIAQKNMSTEWLKRYEVALPPINIQERVVEDFESEQRIIEANKKLINLYQQKIQNRLAEIWGE